MFCFLRRALFFRLSAPFANREGWVRIRGRYGLRNWQPSAWNDRVGGGYNLISTYLPPIYRLALSIRDTCFVLFSNAKLNDFFNNSKYSTS